jgi:hypothetical protein
MVVQAKSNPYVLAVSLASNSLLLSSLFSLYRHLCVGMERVVEPVGCGVAAFWLAMMLFLSRCCVCASAMKGGGMMGMRLRERWSTGVGRGGEASRQLIDPHTARAKRSFGSGIGGTLAAAHRKVAFCLFAWARRKWPRLDRSLAIPAENFGRFFCPPYTSPVHSLSQSSQLQPQESKPSGSCLVASIRKLHP